MEEAAGFARLGPVGDLDLRPVFQPILDLRDGGVVGYEAFMRSGPEDGELHSARAMLDAARREDSVAALDHAARDAAIAHAEEAGLGAPFCLFLNTDATTLEGDVPLPDSSLTLLMDVTERALIARPEAVLRALTELRTRGWGIALDDVGADSRSLALTPVLYPDVIKLDLRLLDDRSSEDVARIVMAVGAEAERRHAVILAEGIHSPEQLEFARVCGATLGQGYHLGPPGPLPAPAARARAPDPAGRRRRRPVRHDAVAAGDQLAPPAARDRRLAARALEPLLIHAGDVGETAMVLGCLVREKDAERAVRRFGWLQERVAFVGVLNAGDAFEGTGVRSGELAPDDPLLGTGTVVDALARLRRLLRRPRGRTTAAGSGRSPTTARPWSSARCSSSRAWSRCLAGARGELGDDLGELAALPGERRAARLLRAQLRPRDRLRVALPDGVGWPGSASSRLATTTAGSSSSASSSHDSKARERGTCSSASATASGCSCAPSRWCRTLTTVSRHASGTSGSP